jgi:hypothetical protein
MGLKRHLQRRPKALFKIKGLVGIEFQAGLQSPHTNML